jgi:transcription termination factor Rho
MTVLERSELEASPLADLHAIADQLGLDGFRRLRKAQLIDAILDHTGAGGNGSGGAARARGGASDGASGASEDDSEGVSAARAEREPGTRRRRSSRTRSARASADAEGQEREVSAPVREERAVKDRPVKDRPPIGDRPADRQAEGVVELLGNGSAFLRVSPPDPSDDDVYISAAQVRRCELVSGDRVSGPVRTPRRSERYPSLARVDTINGASAESVAEGTRYEDLPVVYPGERLQLDSQDATLGAIEWLTPIGRGSRATIVGAARSGKTETLRRLLGALAGRDDLEVMLVLSGIRPEETAPWREGPVAPAVALDFAVSADLQGQAVEHAVDTARRVAARGGDAVVLIDSLDGLPSQVARKVLAGARNLAEGGSLTVIATATRPFGGETTVIALDVALTSTGRLPALDLVNSGTVRPELLVGEDGARAITEARAAAVTGQAP